MAQTSTQVRHAGAGSVAVPPRRRRFGEHPPGAFTEWGFVDQDLIVAAERAELEAEAAKPWPGDRAWEQLYKHLGATARRRPKTVEDDVAGWPDGPGKPATECPPDIGPGGVDPEAAAADWAPEDHEFGPADDPFAPEYHPGDAEYGLPGPPRGSADPAIAEYLPKRVAQQALCDWEEACEPAPNGEPVYRRARIAADSVQAITSLYDLSEEACHNLLLGLSGEGCVPHAPPPTGESAVDPLRRPGSPQRIRLRYSDRYLELYGVLTGLLNAAFGTLGGQELGQFLADMHNASEGALLEHAGLALERVRAEQHVEPEELRNNWAVLDPESVAADTVAAEQRVGVGKARSRVRLAVELPERFPLVWRRIQGGGLDGQTAQDILHMTAFVEGAEALAEIERRILEELDSYRGTRMGKKALRTRLARLVEQADPMGARQRAARSDEDRYIEVVPERDGFAAVQGDLPATHAEILDARLDQIAGLWADDPDETRTYRQLRADAMVALALGRAPGEPVAPADGEDLPPLPGFPPAATVTAQVTVIADGAEQLSAWTARGGATTMARLEDLIEQAARTSVQPVGLAPPRTLDGLIGAAKLALAELADHLRQLTTYSPGAELARRVRLRDGTCRHPGCTVPAARCDLDHVVPFNHADPLTGGLTCEENLACMCRRHHRLKTHGDASYRLMPDGSLECTIGSSGPYAGTPSGPLGVARGEEGLLYDDRQRLGPGELTELVAALSTLVDEVAGPHDHPGRGRPREHRPRRFRSAERARDKERHRRAQAARLQREGKPLRRPPDGEPPF